MRIMIHLRHPVYPVALALLMRFLLLPLLENEYKHQIQQGQRWKVLPLVYLH